jgi:hypothetical protein
MWKYSKAENKIWCRLAKNVITPTTKSAEHDEPIGPKEIVSDGLMTQKEWDEVRIPLSIHSPTHAPAHFLPLPYLPFLALLPFLPAFFLSFTVVIICR